MKNYFCLLILLLPFIGSAQKQGNLWYFGNQSGLDFSTGSPVPISGGQTGVDYILSQEGTASIADSSGNLLFYTGGKTIWNRNHTVMPNGSNLFGGPSSTQSSLIVPLPNNNNQFYVFTSGQFQEYNSPPVRGYRYNIVDMCLDGGNGDIVPGQKNILLADSSTEKLSACLDALGTGYWIVGHKMFSNKFMAWHLTSTGISGPVISTIGRVHGLNYVNSNMVNGAAQGQMKFNSTGTKLAVAISNNQPAILELFDFDPSTGVLSNNCFMAIDSLLDKQIYGIEFSPDDSKLYAGLTGGSGGKRIYQYDLAAGSANCSSMIASQTTIFQSNDNSVLYGMQLAPDGKIYVVCDSYHEIACINYPNLTGAAVGFVSPALTISGLQNNYTFPNFIAGYAYQNTIPDCSITSTANIPENQRIELYPNPAQTVGTLEIDPQISIQGLEFYIYDALGKTIYQSDIRDYKTNINVEHLARGVYFYKVTDKHNIIKSGKIILE